MDNYLVDLSKLRVEPMCPLEVQIWESHDDTSYEVGDVYRLDKLLLEGIDDPGYTHEDAIEMAEGWADGLEGLVVMLRKLANEIAHDAAHD